MLGLVLRLWGVSKGLPNIWHPDAHQYVGTAWLMSLDSLNPRDRLPVLTNSHLYVYLLFGLKGLICLCYGMFSTPEAQQRFIDGGGLVLAARAMGGVLGAMSVLVAYRIGALCFGRPVGIASAALLSTNFFTVRNAHFAMPDVTMIFFLLFAMERSAVYVRTGRLRHLWIASCLAGITTATKVTGGVAILCPLTALFLRRRGRTWGQMAALVLAAAGCAGVTFCCLSPYMLVDLRGLLDIWREVSLEGGARGHVQEPVPVWLLHHRHYVIGMGWTAYVLSIVGAVVLLITRPKVAAWLLVAPGVYLAVHLNRSLCYARYTLPPVPFLLVAAAWGASWLCRRLSSKRAAFGCVVALACAGPLARSMRLGWLCTQEDTRTQARRWVQEHVPRHGVVLVEGNFPPIPTHPYCVYARDRAPHIAGRVDLDYFVSDMTVRKFLRFNRTYGHYWGEVYDQVEASFPVVKELRPYRGDRSPPYHSTQVNAPAIRLWQTTRPGPHIRIYKIRDPIPRPLPEKLMLKPPLTDKDWDYIARDSNFPMGMLTRDWTTVGNAEISVQMEMARLSRE